MLTRICHTSVSVVILGNMLALCQSSPFFLVSFLYLLSFLDRTSIVCVYRSTYALIDLFQGNARV